MLFLVVQDIAHAGERTCVLRPRQRLGRGQLIAGFEVSINCRFCVSTEGLCGGCSERHAVNHWWKVNLNAKRGVAVTGKGIIMS